LGTRIESGPPRAEDLSSLVMALLDLGDLDGAARRLQTHGKGCLDPAAARRLQAAIALRRGDYPRASDLLRGLGPSPLLAYGSMRAGEYALAVETLEGLLARDDDPRTRKLLERTYRDMVAADLLGGSRRLQAETTLTFGEGAAA
jgi:tetratricopeptide (TPR) repeat protein